MYNHSGSTPPSENGSGDQDFEAGTVYGTHNLETLHGSRSSSRLSLAPTLVENYTAAPSFNAGTWMVIIRRSAAGSRGPIAGSRRLRNGESYGECWPASWESDSIEMNGYIAKASAYITNFDNVECTVIVRKGDKRVYLKFAVDAGQPYADCRSEITGRQRAQGNIQVHGTRDTSGRWIGNPCSAAMSALFDALQPEGDGNLNAIVVRSVVPEWPTPLTLAVQDLIIDAERHVQTGLNKPWELPVTAVRGVPPTDA